MSLIKELRTRNVLKVSVVYAVSAWILLQLAEMLTAYFAWPDWVPQVFLVLLIVGFVPAVLAAWAFEITTEGVKLEKDVVRPKAAKPKKRRRLDVTILVTMALGLAVFIWKSDYEGKLVEVETMSAEQARQSAEPPVTIKAQPVLLDDIEQNSIAVLPFANLSADPADVYFADGIHEDLLAQLARIDDFRVIARTSVREYRDSAKDLRTIANELRVANIMEGTVQRVGDRVRINVQLIDARTSGHLWAETYDRELTTNNLFDIQSEIARAIVQSMQATLTDAELAGLGDVPTDNVEAYDLYLKARQLARGETRSGFQEAYKLYQQALALDPAFKLGWIGLAHVHINNYWSYGGDPADAASTRAAIEKAREIDPDFPELFMAEGFYWYWGHLDYERALYNLDKAISSMPGNSEAHMWHGWASRRSGLWEQGEASMRRSLRLDPRVSYNWAELGGTYMFLHHFEESRVALLESLAVNPDDYWGKTNLADLGLMTSGNIESALKLTEGAENTVEYSYFEQYMDTRNFAGHFEEALTAARNVNPELEVQRNLIMLREIWAAQTLFFMGQKDEAKQAANAALFRLKSLGEKLGEDYRLDMAHAMLSPILGESAKQLDAKIQKSVQSSPADSIQDILFQIRYARIYAMAGRTAEAIEQLEPLFTPPSETSTHTVDLDPAFDGIRENPEFVAMMERYR